MKHLFIVNPTAGGKDHTSEIQAKAEQIFASRSDSYEVYTTSAPKDATFKVEAEAEMYDQLRVYACGGDGTFNECACGAALRKNVAVAPHPTGTGNDFCRMFGEEQDLFRNLEALVSGKEHPLDLIQVNGVTYSANICSVGIDARIGTGVHKYTGIPVIGHSVGYVVSLVVNVLSGINRHMDITCGDFHSSGPHALVCACNGRYYGGGFNPSLTAMPDDGELDLYIVDGVNVLTVASLIGKYASGRSDEAGSHITHLHGTEVSIRFKEKNVVNIDGEAIHTDSVHMKLIPGAARLIVPAGMTFFDKH